MCKRHCLECAASLAEKDYRAEFCGTVCRKAWNNRRMVRGAELYDLFYSLRYDRDKAKTLGLWSAMCKLAQKWRDEDRVSERTRTCRRPEDVLMSKPTLRATTLQK